MKIDIKEKTKVYVLCPPNIKTGGTELAHQLVYLLNKNNIEAYITYLVEKHTVKICDAFYQYCSEYKTLNEVDDIQENYIVIPEAWTFLADRYSKITKAIWWMSVDNYLKNKSTLFALRRYGFSQAVKTCIKNITRQKKQMSIKKLKNIDYHFIQSEYARRYLEKYGISSMWLSDYINDIYCKINYDDCLKENIVCYNPAKGKHITQKIISNYEGSAQWVPLINMTNLEMQNTLKKAKVYIDFGNFPGKDRIPREAAASYCCIITGMFGASGNSIDLPIPGKYKIDRPISKIKDIISLINDCIDNYDSRIMEFDDYRRTILSEKHSFEQQVKDIFC